MKVAIHQPNFLPWIGLFQRLFLADVFVFFDHVQAMQGRSWLSRNRLLIGGKEAWVTIPVYKSGRGGQRVSEVEVNYQIDFVPKLLKTIELNYKKAPFFNEIFPPVAEMFQKRHQFIGDLNMEFTYWVASLLGLPVRFVRSSKLLIDNPIIDMATGNDLVLKVCHAAGGSQYISGVGCLDFIQPRAFEDVGIEFYFQKFEHPIYRQVGAREFVSQLSILDALFNVGPHAVYGMVAQPSIERAILEMSK